MCICIKRSFLLENLTFKIFVYIQYNEFHFIFKDQLSLYICTIENNLIKEYKPSIYSKCFIYIIINVFGKWLIYDAIPTLIYTYSYIIIQLFRGWCHVRQDFLDN